MKLAALKAHLQEINALPGKTWRFQQQMKASFVLESQQCTSSLHHPAELT
jgi:hypothetical protein